MKYKIKRFLKSFTLIELIIVIAIIAVLGVSAFLLLNNWIQKSNTAKVNSDILVIKKSLNISYIGNGIMPKPGGINKKIVQDEGSNSLWYQGEFDEEVISKLGNLNKVPLMKGNQKYLYSLSFTEKDYQICGFVDKIVGNKINNIVLADDKISVVEGNFNGFIMAYSGDDKYIWNVPTMFLASGEILHDNEEYNIFQNNKSIDNKVLVKKTVINNLYNDNQFDDCLELDNFLLKYSEFAQSRQQAKDYILKAANQNSVKISCGDGSGMVYLDLEKVKSMDFSVQTNKDYLLSVLYTKIGYSKYWSSECNIPSINVVEKPTGGAQLDTDYEQENTVYVLKDDTSDYTFASTINLGKCSSIVGLSNIKSTNDLGVNGLIKFGGNNVIDGVSLNNSSVNTYGLYGDLVDNISIIRTNIVDFKTTGIKIKGGVNYYIDSANIGNGAGYGISGEDASDVMIVGGQLSRNHGVYFSNINNSKLTETQILSSLHNGILLDGSMSNSLESVVVSGGTLDGIKFVNLSTANSIIGSKTIYNGQWGVNMTDTCGNEIKTHISGLNGQSDNGGISNGVCNLLSALTDLGGIPIPGECGIASGGMFLNPQGIIESSRCELGVSEGIYATGDKIKWECDNEGAKVSCEANRLLVSGDEGQVTKNPNFMCAVYTGGNEARCWGYNYYGQLGNGTNNHSSVPVKVQGLSDVASINSNGGQQVCAVKKDGTLWCWGYNARGQLGNNTTIDSNIPVRAQGLTNVKKVVTNNGTVCALTTDKKLYCWGFGSYNMQGNVVGAKYIPTLSYSAHGGTIEDVGLGNRHSCIVNNLGEVYCVGYNTYGNLGIGTNTEFESTIQKVSSLSGIKSINIGNHQNIALKSDGTAWGWGDNNLGKLGIGSDEKRNLPTKVLIEGLDSVNSIANSSIGIRSNGEIYFWGSNLNYNFLGINNHFSNIPLKSNLNIGDYLNVVLGGNSSTLVKKDGSLEIVGLNIYGQLGEGVFDLKSSPYSMNGIPEYKIIGTYENSGFYIDSSGKLFVRGSNEFGELGIGSFTYSYDFVRPNNISELNIVKADIKDNSFFALDSNGDLYAWGMNDFGQLGNGTVSPDGVTRPVKIMSAVLDFSMTLQSACALKIDKTVWCWGRNNYGQVGSSSVTSTTTSYSATPVKLTTISNIESLKCQNQSCFAVVSNGDFYGWGYNNYGQLGDGSTTKKTVPYKILGSISDFHLGTHNVYARKVDGTLWSWGYNIYGQVGIGNISTIMTPAKVMDSFKDYANITGAARTCVIKDDKTLWCRGQNNTGQGGNGTTQDILLPQKVVGISNVKRSFGNGSTTCVQDESNEYYCWGNLSFKYLLDN